MKRKGKIIFIPTGEILPNPNQPRSFFNDEALNALADNIKRFGMIQPMVVKKRENIPKLCINGEYVTAPAYEIVAGERRLRAARKIGMTQVPCIVAECGSESSAYMAFSENVFREDLSFFDIASALSDMLATQGITQTELAKRLGISQSAIANKLRLLRLTMEEREFAVKNRISERHIRAVLCIDNPEKRLCELKKIAENSFFPTETEKYINGMPPKEEKKFHGRKICKISDIGVFINSINNAVRMVRDVGVEVERRDVDSGDRLEIFLSIPKLGAKHN